MLAARRAMSWLRSRSDESIWFVQLVADGHVGQPGGQRDCEHHREPGEQPDPPPEAHRSRRST
jgi:hypothetical protein